jgi:chromatin remodeling complex protein RSC6
MVRSTKTTSTATPAQSVATEATKTKATKTTAASKTTKTTKVATPVAPTPVVAAVGPVVPPAAPVVEEETAGQELAEASQEFSAKLHQVSTLLSALKAEYKQLERKWTRELKTAQKSASKRKRKGGARQPSGFVKPTKISDELAAFLEKPKGSEMARTEVTRDINKYIRTHNLQDAANGRKINADDKLSTLLKLKERLKDDEELTYFNLQRFMSPHFAKATATPATTTTV